MIKNIDVFFWSIIRYLIKKKIIENINNHKDVWHIESEVEMKNDNPNY